MADQYVACLFPFYPQGQERTQVVGMFQACVFLPGLYIQDGIRAFLRIISEKIRQFPLAAYPQIVRQKDDAPAFCIFKSAEKQCPFPGVFPHKRGQHRLLGQIVKIRSHHGILPFKTAVFIFGHI